MSEFEQTLLLGSSAVILLGTLITWIVVWIRRRDE